MRDTDKREIRYGGLDGSAVKRIAVIAMLIDHAAVVLLTRSLEAGEAQLYGLYYFMRQVGRLSFPLFCFMLVEGFERTGSRAKYAMRLGAFALISEIPFDLAFQSRVLELGSQNVFFTLLCGMGAMCAYDFLRCHRPPRAVQWALLAAGAALFGGWLTGKIAVLFGVADRGAGICLFCSVYLAAAVLFLLYGRSRGRDELLMAGMGLAVTSVLVTAADLLRTDYGGVGVLTVAVIFAFRRFRLPAMAAGSTVLALLAPGEICALCSVIPIAFYNGRRGSGRKYFFYIFYPAHLLLLWLVSLVIFQ